MLRSLYQILTVLLWGSLCAQPSPTAVSPEAPKPQLLVFSGSDWCLPCIRLEKEVFSTPEFQNFARQSLEITRVDFPQKNILAPQQVKRNDSLARLYNPEGAFPFLLLLSPQGHSLAQLPADLQTPREYIRLIGEKIKPDLKEYRRQELLMGSRFEFVILHHNEEQAYELLQYCVDEVTRLENILSEWIEDSEVSQLNRMAGISPVKVSPELYQLVQRSIKISGITQGAFDISFQGLGLWQFDQKEHAQLPSPDSIQKQLRKISYEKIELLPPDKIFLKEKGMAIGFGASGKGFAADYLKAQLQKKGVESGVINASGDLITWGSRADGSPWNVGVSNPNRPELLQFGIPLQNRAIATSGNYEKYFTHKGKRYAHIIDPKTGYPVTGKKSVTVISPSAELADALATAFFVLEVEIALDLASQLPDVHCLIIDESDKIHLSHELELAK